MIPVAFDYVAASSVEDAIALLEDHGEDAKVLAGGHSLIPLMKLRLAAPSALIDIGRIPSLSYIREDGDHVSFGATTTHFSVESSDVVRNSLPVIADAASHIGDPQVRNRGTLGGSCAHADPASDMPGVLLALDAQFVATGPFGERVIEAADFFQDIWTSALKPTEILTEIRVPCRPQNRGQAYYKFRQRAADWAIVGAAVSLDERDGVIDRASVVLTNVGATPVRAWKVEEALSGRTPTAQAVLEASEYAAEGLNPSAELKASPDYKRHLARVVTRRALESALGVASWK